ncbi:SulP family inorganic anion transporter [Fluviispira vulneris]|uniref:SulP family inorganic anion transporter n=1 Tax=Fluviispira vulneris TaxID=2763012 RepID=UPI00164888A8|nr:SulP family inorganic anion transporter [Fluviispira vulneris]
MKKLIGYSNSNHILIKNKNLFHKKSLEKNIFNLKNILHINDLAKDLTDNWLEVLRSKSLIQDIIAAITVASVALPLNIALAVACGLPASTGIIAGAVGGGIAALFGGSALQVTGPAAALSFMILSITKEFGAVGVAGACIIIAIIQFLLSLLKAGRFIKFMPEAVLVGFTTGVGLRLLDNQFPELLGFNSSVFAISKIFNRSDWLHEVSWHAVVCGLVVALLVTSCKQFKRFPAAFVGIVIVTEVSTRLDWSIQRVGSIPSFLPLPSLPLLSLDRWIQLLALAIPLAFLASIESLLSAQAIDRISHSKKSHNSNLELFGQGFANLGSGLFGGMPVSGVIVRSSVNVQCGAKTRLSSLLHAVLLLVCIFYLADTMASIPLAALAGLLCVIGLRLVEFKTFFHLLKAQKFAALSFALTMIGTVSGHLLWGLLSGILVFSFGYWLKKPEKKTEISPLKSKNIRGHLPSRIKVEYKKPTHYTLPIENQNWLTQIREKAYITASAFVHQKASLIGRIVLGDHVHIAAESSIRADEGTPFFIGSNSNIQDGVVIHALKEKWVSVGGEDWAVYIGENVSVAHQALVHGPCFIGDNSFIGFQAIVHDSIIGSHCYIGIGAIVVGVEIPAGRYVPHGMVVDSLDKVDILPQVTDAHMNFNEDVVDVNKGLVAAYKKHNGHFDTNKKNLENTSMKWKKTPYKF